MFGIIKIIVYIMVFSMIVFGLAIVLTDGKILKKSVKDKSKGSTNKDANKATKQASKKDDIKVGTTQDFLDFEDIEIFSKDNPMGLIVKKNKTEFVGIIEVFGLNYNLLSIEERLSLEESFSRLLNGIDYPIQIYVQSRTLDIDNYEHKYDTRLDDIKKNIESLSSRLEFLKGNNEDKEKIAELDLKVSRLISQYNYGVEVKNYMMSRSKQKNILERKYYIVISYKYNSSMFEENLTYDEILSNAFFDISNKANSLINALTRAKLGGKILNGVELAEVLYSAYNKQESSVYKITNALKSQFSHLYTTSTPVEVKKIARQIEKIEEQEAEEYKKLEELAEKLHSEEDYDNFDIDDSELEMELDELDDNQDNKEII